MTKRQNTIDNLVYSSTGDIITNDFDLNPSKPPELSTIRTQIRTATTLMEQGYTFPLRIEFDRLRMGIYLPTYAEKSGFINHRMEDVPNPQKRPTLQDNKELGWERIAEVLRNATASQEQDNISDSVLDDMYDDLFGDSDENIEQTIPEDKEVLADESEDIKPNNNESYKNRKIKKRIRYSDYKDTIGLLNTFICDGFFVIDITGKWMHENGVLGSLHIDNIKEALQKFLDLHVVSFDIDAFLEYSQVFCCDVLIDLLLNSQEQVHRYIQGISSFFPISTNRFNIAKYGKHGLTLVPKAKHHGFSPSIYSKGSELSHSLIRTTCATRYTRGIGELGEELAKRTLRFEAKFYRLYDMRKWLGIPEQTKRVVRLMDVLNSTEPVILKVCELFSGNAEALLDRLKWLYNTANEPETSSLQEIAIAEWTTNHITQNNNDIELARAHVETEYFNVKEEELQKFLQLANLRKNLLNFIVYKKPRSTTVMLSVLSLLQAYYSASNGEV